MTIILAARLSEVCWVIAGIFAATIWNHALARLVVCKVAGLTKAPRFCIAVALGFIATAP